MMDKIRQGIRTADASGLVFGFGDYRISDKARAFLQTAIALLEKEGHEAAFLMVDLQTGQGACYNPDRLFFSASAIKGIYVAALLCEMPELLSTHRDEIEATVLRSSNDDYAFLRRAYGPGPLEKYCEAVGVRKEIASEDYVDITLRELALLWTRVFEAFDDGDFGEALGKLYENTKNSAINILFHKSCRTRTKAGWTENVTVDAGIVYSSEGPFLLACMTTQTMAFSNLATLAFAASFLRYELRLQALSSKPDIMAAGEQLGGEDSACIAQG